MIPFFLPVIFANFDDILKILASSVCWNFLLMPFAYDGA